MLLVDFAACPLHVFVLVLHAFALALLAYLLLKAIAKDMQTLILALRTFYKNRVNIKLNKTLIFKKTHQLRRPFIIV